MVLAGVRQKPGCSCVKVTQAPRARTHARTAPAPVPVRASHEPRRAWPALDADRVEGVAGARADAALIEDVRDLGIGVVVEQGGDLLAHVGIRGA